MNPPPTIYIVDDDFAVRDSLALLLETAGFIAETFDCAEAFLARLDPDMAGCLILDVLMPGMSGPELQAELIQRQVGLPILFLSAYGDVPTTVQAIQAGAVDFLTKPVDSRHLLQRVRAALQRDIAARTQRARLSALTEREREVLTLAVAGCSNKEIGARLGISHRTVEIHRSHILLKTGAGNLLELVRLVDACGLPIPGDK